MLGAVILAGVNPSVCNRSGERYALNYRSLSRFERKRGFNSVRNKTLRGTVILAIPACGKAVQIDVKFVIYSRFTASDQS